MDHGHLDALTRSVSEGGTRRAIFRLLAGGALGGVATRLGLTVSAESKGKTHKNAKRTQPLTTQAERKRQDDRRVEQSRDRLQAERKGKKKRKGPKKPKPTPCGPNLKSCPDGSCIATNTCCPGRKSCPTEGCIPDNECCELTAPLCGECQEEFCDNGTWTCRSTTNLSTCQQCPAGSVFCSAGLGNPPWDWFDLPPGCCPLDRYVWDDDPAGYWCKQPDGPGAVLMLCD